MLSAQETPLKPRFPFGGDGTVLALCCSGTITEPHTSLWRRAVTGSWPKSLSPGCPASADQTSEGAVSRPREPGGGEPAWTTVWSVASRLDLQFCQFSGKPPTTTVAESPQPGAPGKRAVEPRGTVRVAGWGVGKPLHGVPARMASTKRLCSPPQPQSGRTCEVVLTSQGPSVIAQGLPRASRAELSSLAQAPVLSQGCPAGPQHSGNRESEVSRGTLNSHTLSKAWREK